MRENYQYWDLNTKGYLDVFWAGYGEYLCPDDESSTKTILDFPGNTNRIYFDLEAFIEVKDELYRYFKKPKEDNIILFLVNCHKGSLHFDESIMIRLEEGQGNNSTELRNIMEFIRNECRLGFGFADIKRKVLGKKFKKLFRNCTVIDVALAAISCR